MADRLTGKQSYFTYAGTNIPITKATLKVPRKDADTTDNGDYNSSQDLLNPTQLIVSAQPEFSIEGRFRKSVTPGLNATCFQSNPGGLPARLGLDSGTIAGSGSFDITNFTTDDPVDDTVTYTCDMKCNGTFTPDS